MEFVIAAVCQSDQIVALTEAEIEGHSLICEVAAGVAGENILTFTADSYCHISFDKVDVIVVITALGVVCIKNSDSVISV